MNPELYVMMGPPVLTKSLSVIKLPVSEKFELIAIRPFCFAGTVQRLPRSLPVGRDR